MSGVRCYKRPGDDQYKEISQILQPPLMKKMFHNSIDKQLIQIYTGHQSMSGVRCYKRPGDDEYKEISQILQPPLMKNSKLAIENQENIDPSESKSGKSLAPHADKIESVVKTALSTGGTYNAHDGDNITFNFNFQQVFTLSVLFI